MNRSLILFCSFFACQLLVAQVQVYKAGPYAFSLTKPGQAAVSFDAKVLEKEVLLVTLDVSSLNGQVLSSGDVSVLWSVPLTDIAGCWTPNGNEPRFMQMSSSLASNLASQAPVVSFFGNNSMNAYTFALSDAFHPTAWKISVNEEEARLDCSVSFKLGGDPNKDKGHYKMSIRLDSRKTAFYQSLKDVSSWWAAMQVYQPAATPEAAKLPVYSTWYSYHQDFTEEALLAECSAAKAMGYETIIVDDGWQTLDTKRGYAYTGDWNPERIKNMAAFVKKVHQVGMKFMLWYSVPFVGYQSSAFERFRGKYLQTDDRRSVGVLDPRYPDVRKFIVDKYLADLRDWDLDGFKLDFIDSFTSAAKELPPTKEGADFDSLYEALDQLMLDIKQTLTAVKPDVMIEFRQSYIGPAMRKYGNMFRAGDCPDAALTNRIRTTDIKLLAGTTAVHSDMLMWNYQAPVQLAALQFSNILFAVPQLSVRLKDLPASQLDMLKFYTAYWRENRDILLNGDFRPLNPELNYPVLMSVKDHQCIAGLYADMLIPVPEAFRSLDIVNAKNSENVAFQLSEAADCRIDIQDCEGRTIERKEAFHLAKGINYLKVPPSGIVRMRTL